MVDPIPPARDVAWPGVITLSVDASDVTRGVFHVTETIPVAAAGPLTLLYPKWLPGNHSDSGPILATGRTQTRRWRASAPVEPRSDRCLRFPHQRA